MLNTTARHSCVLTHMYGHTRCYNTSLRRGSRQHCNTHSSTQPLFSTTDSNRIAPNLPTSMPTTYFDYLFCFRFVTSTYSIFYNTVRCFNHLFERNLICISVFRRAFNRSYTEMETGPDGSQTVEKQIISRSLYQFIMLH